MPAPAVFLDRDGVLNEPVRDGHRERPPFTPSEVVIVDGAMLALDRLHEAGLRIVVVTNQPDVGRGDLARDMADQVNDEIRALLPIDALYACFHAGDEGCGCRKPRPGMLTTAAGEMNLDLTRSWLVGDRWVDIAAGRAAGVATILIQRSTSWDPTSAGRPRPDLRPDAIAAGVEQAAAIILTNRS